MSIIDEPAGLTDSEPAPGVAGAGPQGAAEVGGAPIEVAGGGGVGPVDDGQVVTYPDGSISIPVFEERLVAVRRSVVVERVIVRKGRVTYAETVEADVRRERVEVDADPSVADRVTEPASLPVGTGVVPPT